MKSRLRLFLILLLGLSLAGCESKGFKAEREMWRANKLAQAIYRNPKGTPPFELTQAQNAYRKIIEKYPNSLFAVESKFGIGHLFLITGQFQKARDEYKKMTLDCTKRGNLCAEAYFAIGKSYESEGQWDNALANYKLIMQTFPFSSKSIDLPIYIIRHYKRAKDDKGVRRSVDEAVSHYVGLKSKPEAEKGGYALQALVSRSYMEGGQWQDALDSFNKIIRDYPKNNPDQALFVRAVIYYNKLQDKAKAKEELLKLIKEYPQSRLVKAANAVLKKL